MLTFPQYSSAQHLKMEITPCQSQFQQQQTSPLLDLSAELRNQIYALVLIEQGAILVQRDDIYNTCWSPPALLCTCRGIRPQASSIYFSNNVFQIRPIRDEIVPLAMQWLIALGCNASACQKIYLDDKYYHMNKVADRLQRVLSEFERNGVNIRQGALFVELTVFARRDAGLSEGWVNLDWMLANRPEYVPRGGNDMIDTA